MIIDFHTHSFPDSLAGRAVAGLAESARAKHYLNGTLGELQASMQETGIDYSVLLPVVTKPGQQENINRIAIEINERYEETGLLSFGGIHPENADYRQILRRLTENGVKGIKLHPVFQRTYLDDIRYQRIVDAACEKDMIITVHAGYDISSPGLEYATVPHIISLLDTVKPKKFVLAHMGGWACWERVEQEILGRDVWLDTSFSLLPIRSAPGTVRRPEENPPLTREQFLGMVRIHGVNKILFGTDSPWSHQGEMIEAIQKSGLTPQEQDDVLGGNAARLLGLA